MYVVTQEFDNSFLSEQCELHHKTPQFLHRVKYRKIASPLGKGIVRFAQCGEKAG